MLRIFVIFLLSKKNNVPDYWQHWPPCSPACPAAHSYKLRVAPTLSQLQLKGWDVEWPAARRSQGWEWLCHRLPRCRHWNGAVKRMLCNSIICEELSDLVEWEHVEPASLISRWVKTHLSTILHWICIDQESLPWPAFKGPTRMAFFSSKAGRRLLTVKYLGTIYPCDTRKMLGIIRWCCKNTQCIEIWLSAHLFDLMWRSWTTLPYCITLPSALEEDKRSHLTKPRFQNHLVVFRDILLLLHFCCVL